MSKEKDLEKFFASKILKLQEEIDKNSSPEEKELTEWIITRNMCLKYKNGVIELFDRIFKPAQIGHKPILDISIGFLYGIILDAKLLMKRFNKEEFTEEFGRDILEHYYLEKYNYDRERVLNIFWIIYKNITKYEVKTMVLMPDHVYEIPEEKLTDLDYLDKFIDSKML